jgi:hypothetical protein
MFVCFEKLTNTVSNVLLRQKKGVELVLKIPEKMLTVHPPDHHGQG